VPASTLTRAFGFPTQWDQKYRVLTVISSRFYQYGNLGDWVGRIEQFEGPPQGYPRRVRAFEGPPYPAPPVVPVAVIEKNKHLMFRLKNISRKNFPYMFIDVLVNGSRGEQLYTAGIPYPASYPHPWPTRLLKAGATLDFGASSEDYEMSTADVVTSQPHSIPGKPVGFVTSTTTRHKVAFVAVWVVPFVP